MGKGVNIDGVLVTWGDRLFYPGNRTVKGGAQPKLRGDALRRRAQAIRSRIEATVVRRAPQVMVKVTGGGRCMRAIAAHFRYISKNGRLDVEDDRGERLKGPHAVRDLAEDWRFSGDLIPEGADSSQRREAFNIMLSMPRGTDPMAVQRAAREFAREELAGHKYVMVLHDHQANPHVHISVRAEGRDGRRLNPRKTDLARWRETFAEKLQDLGIEAEATKRSTRLSVQMGEPLWRLRAKEDQRLRSAHVSVTAASRQGAVRAAEAWVQIARALTASTNSRDAKLAGEIEAFLQSCPGAGQRPAVEPNVQPSRGADQTPRR